MTQSFYSSRQWLGCALLLGILILNSQTHAQDIPPRKFAVQISAEVQEVPPRIVLNWEDEGDAESYRVSRRGLDTSWEQIALLGPGEIFYADAAVAVGKSYEYQIIKTTGNLYTGYGYISTGIRLPIVASRGKVILLVENSLAAALGPELARLQLDLVGDGWSVIRRDVSSASSPQAVKSLIQGIHATDPRNVKALFLLGHVPVPYSGNIAPDGHGNHRGAWPADVYYADVDGLWTDSEIDTNLAERTANWNVPGDGKFDQSRIPSEVELMMGRVDLSNLTCFANKTNARSEIDLTRQYLNKNHAFRMGEVTVERRGLICDNFSDKGRDPISNSAWRSFTPFFGPGQVTEVGWDGYLAAATQSSYLWSYASGGGSYYYSSGVATSDDFALQDLQVVFTMFMGSYFGDWNNESNFLRASLGSGYVLTATYSGFPHTLYFPMAMGEPIGHSVRLTQNNSTNSFYPPWNQGAAQVHIALLGDPTLRLAPMRGPIGLTAASGNPVQLAWSAAPGENVGYHVYRSLDVDGPFTRLTAEPVTQTSFADHAASGHYTYMVRAVKLEQSGSGTYLNQSQGIFASAFSTGGPQQPPAPPILEVLAALHDRIDLGWTNVEGATGYAVERRIGSSSAWSELNVASSEVSTFIDDEVSASTEYFYRIRAFNPAGSSAYSLELRVLSPSGEVTPISNKPLLLSLQVLPSGAALTVQGDSGQKFRIYRSPDLMTWTEVGTSNLLESSLRVPVPIDQNAPQGYFRTLNYR